MGIIVRNMNMSDFSHVRLSPKGFGAGVGGGAGNTTLLSSALGWDGVTPVNYYGEVPASEFFTCEELSTLLGVTQGTLQNSNTDWFKFGLGDKTLFIPKQTIRQSIS